MVGYDNSEITKCQMVRLEQSSESNARKSSADQVVTL